MNLSLNQASKEANVSKNTILQAIRKGRLTAPKNDKGHYEIEPAELFRLFPKKVLNQSIEPKQTPNDTTYLELEITYLKKQVATLESHNDYLQNQAKTLLLTDQRKRSFFDRIFNKTDKS